MPKSTAKKKTSTKTWAWGIQAANGKLDKSTYTSKADAQWFATDEGQKVVKVNITLAK